MRTRSATPKPAIVPYAARRPRHPAAARNVALLVAGGQFGDPQLKTAQLLGPAIDIDSMQRALTERWGFQPADVVALRDQEATREHILDQIAALEQRSAPGDTVLIYFSGHGTSANDNNNNYDLPYATGAWVPYDLDYSSTAAAARTLIVGRRDLVDLLGDRFHILPPKCVLAIFIQPFC